MRDQITYKTIYNYIRDMSVFRAKVELKNIFAEFQANGTIVNGYNMAGETYRNFCDGVFYWIHQDEE